MIEVSAREEDHVIFNGMRLTVTTTAVFAFVMRYFYTVLTTDIIPGRMVPMFIFQTRAMEETWLMTPERISCDIRPFHA